MGLERKFTEGDFRNLMIQNYDNNIDHNNKNELFHNSYIKLAMVSACMSEEIGSIFLKFGIPVVISVQADEEILDKCA